jgi:hypothetical protein
MTPTTRLLSVAVALAGWGLFASCSAEPMSEAEPSGPTDSGNATGGAGGSTQAGGGGAGGTVPLGAGGAGGGGAGAYGAGGAGGAGGASIPVLVDASAGGAAGSGGRADASVVDRTASDGPLVRDSGSVDGADGFVANCEVNPQRIYDDIAYLASDELRGREPGDVGIDLAIAYAEKAFKAAGLSPAGDQGAYQQAFAFTCQSAYCADHPKGVMQNVLGKIDGSDPKLAADVVVVGGHIDHVGIDAANEVCHGADDNASGAAMVMEMARMFAQCGLAPKRTILFAEWNGEEMGIAGSNWYVAHPTLPIARTIAAYNFDMVGSGDGTGILLFGGSDTANKWLTDLLVNAAKAKGYTHVIEMVPQKLATDHAPFAKKGISTCWGFARPDPHPGYHTPADDIGTIKMQTLRAVSQLFWGAIRPLAMGEEATFGVTAPGASQGN